MVKILVVDDEKPIADILKYNLENEGYQVIAAYDGDEALKMTFEEEPSLIVLDIMLPKKDGLEVCREIRRLLKVPIIMLTAKEEEIDKVLGLELGADDYVTKPFSTREVIARVKAALRREQMHVKVEGEKHQLISWGDLMVNTRRMEVYKKGERLELTYREFSLLSYFLRHQGSILTRAGMLDEVWGYDYLGDMRTVDVMIRRLREKIEDDPGHPIYIKTKRGAGYYLGGPD